MTSHHHATIKGYTAHATIKRHQPMTEPSPTIRQLHHAYGRGYFDGKQGHTANPASHWHPDEIAQYNQGYEEGQNSEVEEDTTS
jgi:hypothetical protein